jgi:hypothetical protein
VFAIGIFLQKLADLNAKAAELRTRMAEFKPKKAAAKKKTAGSVSGETLDSSPTQLASYHHCCMRVLSVSLNTRVNRIGSADVDDCTVGGRRRF